MSHHIGVNLVCFPVCLWERFSTNLFSFVSVFSLPLFFFFLTLYVWQNNYSLKDVHMLIPGACEYVTLLVTWDFIAVIKGLEMGSA